MPCEDNDLASQTDVTDGPGKLSQALGVTLALNGIDLTDHSELFITTGEQVAEREVSQPRGSGYTGDEETRTRPWRFVWQRS